MRSLLIVFLTVVMSLSVMASEPIHVTYLWHMHQPIYYPYESPQTIDANGRFNFSVQGVWDGDRTGAYTSWPKDAVQAGADRGMAHAGAQMSYSGSLGENNNNLWGFCTGASWDDGIDWARNGLRTSLDNPRLDTVGIAYHHSLMPLTCKESMIMQIKLHQEQYMQLWDTSEYSKGFWPPECAFDVNMIPALVEAGLEWVIVDNGHLFRTVPDFPWSDASSCRPNPAEIQNPSSSELGSQWVQLQNVWAPTPVLAPWAYQPHYVQYVDPETGDIDKIVAVPAGRYEGNENGRGGYGAFKPENVWGEHVSSVNNDSSHPMLLLCHSDGDNYGMKNSDAWHGQHQAFLDMTLGNGDFEHTSVQDYLDMYPPDSNDVIHVEPGSWIGIDGGTPYFEKWLSGTYVDGECPDRWSWSVLVAAQNYVLLADSLEDSYLAPGSNMDDVEWGINTDTAAAWHWYLSAETSCYWYWDLDRANPWDGNVTRACNAAINEANKVIGRNPGSDSKGPSIFPPQRDPYNPGGFMWNETEPASSDFDVWSYVFDVNGLNSVTLYYRTDNDGVNPLDSIQNETYAGGSEVGSWNTVSMTNSWDPQVKGPDNIVPSPTARAQKYTAQITGQSQVLVDYYVEAVDVNNNTSRSDIIHCYVGQFNATNAVPVTFSPTVPQDCDDLVVTYNSATRSLESASAMNLLISFDGGSAATNAMAGSQGGTWKYTNAIPGGASQAKVMFASGGTTDNNSGNGWTKDIIPCSVDPSVNFNPPNPDGCDPVEIIYHAGDGPLASASPVYIHVGYNDWQGVPNPDPAMTVSGTNWTYTYWPPAGAYEINCVFHDGTTWDNNGGGDYRVAISNCDQQGAAVIFTPGTPTDCDGSSVTVTYNPTNRPLYGETNVHIDINYIATWYRYPMVDHTNYWTFAGGIPGGSTNVRVKFANANVSPTVTDDNSGQNWSVAVSSCETGGPSTVTFDPAIPTGCDDVTITYYPNEGELKLDAQVYIHVGHDNWQDVITPDPAMTDSGDAWTYVYSPPAGTEEINVCFNNGASTWDNNNGSDWGVSVIGCTGTTAGIRFAEGSPSITSDPPTNQNDYGDAFDFNTAGGYASTSNQGGFGSFGQVYVNYDDEKMYIGARGCDMAGNNNGMVLFLHINTYPDWAAQPNLWSVTGLPEGLDYLHNVTFDDKVCIAIVLGDEWGDGNYANFNLENDYDFGQGLFYVSVGPNANFAPVTNATLSQYDGTGTVATSSNDLDGNRQTDRWECSIPWSAVYATNGISDVTNCTLTGVFASDTTDGTNRYVSANVLGTPSHTDFDEWGNYGMTNNIHLAGVPIGLPLVDSDGDGIPDWWEKQYFTSLGVMSRLGDWDGDGASDLNEWIAFTNPKDVLSCFRCYNPTYEPSGFVLRWHSVSNKQYSIEEATSLTSQDWTPVDTGINATPPENSYTVTVDSVETRFYQVRTQE